VRNENEETKEPKMSRLVEIVTELVAELRDWLFNEDYGE
jgi:hypothetical protein